MQKHFQIGDLEIDTGKATVSRNGTQVALPGLSYDMLLCLARHAPNLVDTDTLMNEVWGKTVVGEETVKQRVKLLRKALGDSSQNPAYFETVRGRGYRLIAEISPVTDRSESSPEYEKNRNWRFPAIVGLMVLALLAISIWFISKNDTSSLADRRVAVLPLSYIGPTGEDDYLADGLTEEIISALAQLTDLDIIARTSVMQYKGAAKPISEIAGELNAGTVIEGSIQRFGENVRIIVQMIDAENEAHYWAQTFDVNLMDFPRIQVELSELVATSLAATVSENGRKALQRNSTNDPAAYDLYLKGRAAYRRWTRQDNEIALAFYRQSLQLDPDFAVAIAGIANSLALKAGEFGSGGQWAEKAVFEANRALAINPDLPEAYKALGIVAFFEGRYKAAMDHYRRALQLEPNYDEALFNLAETCHVTGRWDESVQYQRMDKLRPEGLVRLSVYLRDLGYFEEAERVAERFSRVLPIAYWSDENLSLHFLIQGDFEKAREYARRMKDLYPNSPTGWLREGEIDLWTGNRAQAEKNIRVAVEMGGISNAYARLRLAQLLLDRGQTRSAATLMDEVEVFSTGQIAARNEGWIHRWNLAFIHSLRGKTEAALGWFEKAVELGRRRYEWDEQESAFDLIRHEPRFQAAMQRQRNSRRDMREKVDQQD